MFVISSFGRGFDISRQVYYTHSIILLSGRFSYAYARHEGAGFHPFGQGREQRLAGGLQGPPGGGVFLSQGLDAGVYPAGLRLRRGLGQYKALGVPVIGISRDSAASHARFAEKNALPFLLLSDPERAAIEGFGVWQEKKNYGKVTMGVVRTSFVIGPDGIIEKVFPNAKPDTNAEEILNYLRG